uniref:Sperm-attracting peptide SepSAP n=1 Tax=Sepia officinalis TaxID=6610 RepID=SAPP_SEPOF|nr:RecName: Full=Sperm-attracting peptide SepSAP [Sepia officinalis]
PIDPGV